MNFLFQPLDESHFDLLLRWFEAPHVKKWWDQDIVYTAELVREKYASYVKGYKQINGVNRPIHAYLFYADKTAAGYIQIYRAHDFSHRKQLDEKHLKLGAIDLLIGEESCLGQNLGSKAIIEFLNRHGSAYSHIVVDPDWNNVAAIKCYAKAGFRMEPNLSDTDSAWMIKDILPLD